MQKTLLNSLAIEDRGVKRARYAVLRSAAMPAILIEGGFMSNQAEAKKIYNPCTAGRWRKPSPKPYWVTKKGWRGDSMNPALPIGIFDSGVGGLTVARQIHRVLPHEDLIYLGDTARVPYGTKSPSTVVRFACEDSQFLLQQNVKAVVVACNTCSAWALPILEKKFQVPIFGVITPGVLAALEKSKTQRIGIIGTNATIRSKAYSNGIIARCDTAKVFARACPSWCLWLKKGGSIIR